MRFHRFRRQIASLASFAVLMAAAATAHAHGGMAAADDLGPPLFTSAALAFACYWLVILWPKSKPRGSANSPIENPSRRRKGESQSRRIKKRSTAREHANPVKVSDRVPIDFESRRAAGDA